MLRGHRGGLYVVEFPDHVKIGRAVMPARRLRVHALAGALRIRLFPMWGINNAAERLALRAAGDLGRRRGLLERFDDLSFDQATALVGVAVVHGGGPHALPYDVSLPHLLTSPVRLRAANELAVVA